MQATLYGNGSSNEKLSSAGSTPGSASMSATLDATCNRAISEQIASKIPNPHNVQDKDVIVRMWYIAESTQMVASATGGYEACKAEQ